QDTGGNENFHIFVTDPSSGETRNVTDIEGVRAEIVGVSYEHPETLLIGLNDRDPSLHDVYALDIESGERELVFQNPGYASLVADEDLEVRLGVMQTPGGGFDVY